jgi:hypothetical protein
LFAFDLLAFPEHQIFADVSESLVLAVELDVELRLIKTIFQRHLLHLAQELRSHSNSFYARLRKGFVGSDFKLDRGAFRENYPFSRIGWLSHQPYK